jgi:hypothetical protein
MTDNDEILAILLSAGANTDNIARDSLCELFDACYKGDLGSVKFSNATILMPLQN